MVGDLVAYPLCARCEHVARREAGESEQEIAAAMAGEPLDLEPPADYRV